jgi:hypothetical protein
MTEYGETWGGDSDFNGYRDLANFWIPASTNWVLGFRVDAKAINGDDV